MKQTRLVVTVVLISVMVASTFAYTQLNVQAANRPQDCGLNCPPSPFPPGFTPQFTYTAKFLCNSGGIFGTLAGSAHNIGLEVGFYSTDINIHNPSFSTNDATIVMKIVIAESAGLPDSSPPPAITTVTATPSPYLLRWIVLKPDAAMRLDCVDIILLLFPHGGSEFSSPHKGFIVIYSDTNSLDVWAEYSTQGIFHGQDLNPPAIQVVKIQPATFTP